jgi:hypothetical protein
MFNKSMLAIITFTAGSAQAQPEIDMTGGTETQTTTPAPEPVAVPGVTGGPFSKGTLGLSFPFTLLSNIAKSVSLTAEGVPTVNVLYFLNEKAAIDLIGGINIHKQVIYDNSMPPVGSSDTNFGFAIGAGYRMYKHKGAFHTFIEPQGIITWGDLATAATLELQALGVFGAEAMFTDWASLSGAVGLGLSVTREFEDIQFATTANLAANVYWK